MKFIGWDGMNSAPLFSKASTPYSSTISCTLYGAWHAPLAR